MPSVAVQPSSCSSMILSSRRQQLKQELKHGIFELNMMLCLSSLFAKRKKKNTLNSSIINISFLKSLRVLGGGWLKEPSLMENRCCISNLTVKKRSFYKLAFCRKKNRTHVLPSWQALEPSSFREGRKSIFAIQVQISHILKLQLLRYDSCREKRLWNKSELQRGMEKFHANKDKKMHLFFYYLA